MSKSPKKSKGDKEIIKEQKRYIAQMEKDRRDMIRNYEKFRKELENKREYLKTASSFEDKLVRCYEQSKKMKKKYDDLYNDHVEMTSQARRLEKENVKLSSTLDQIDDEIDRLRKNVTSITKQLNKKNCWDL